jgi:hypothetical protein
MVVSVVFTVYVVVVVVVNLPEKNSWKMADEKDEDDSHENKSKVVLLFPSILLTSGSIQ